MPRPKKSFQILRRRVKGARHVFYVSFRLPDGTLASPRSSGQTSRGAADTWANAQINEGKVPVQNAQAGNIREDLIAFLHDFWCQATPGSDPSPTRKLTPLPRVSLS